ncbi:MAG: hypothetical protein LC104_00775 [Bacteroidales bacterium]|nr:hypothetical protein [Bacteroidales bacterium]
MMRFCGIVVIVALAASGCMNPTEAKKELGDAHKLWDDGKKAEAVEKYEKVIKLQLQVIDLPDRPMVFQRVIEWRVERGPKSVAQEFIGKALDNNVPLTLTDPKAQELLAQVKQEREGKIVQEQERQAHREQEEREQKVKLETEQQELDTPLKVTAEEIFKDYEDNEINAKKKYRAKQQVEVTGTINSVDTVFLLGTPYVLLKPESTLLTGVQCMFTKDDAQRLATLRKGERVTVKGRFQHKLGNVVIGDCELVGAADSGSPTTKTGDKPKLAALRAVVDKLATFPGPLTSEDDRKKYNDELRPLVDQFVDMKFDAQANRKEAEEIIDLYQKRIENRFKGHFANLLEAGAAQIVADLRK